MVRITQSFVVLIVLVAVIVVSTGFVPRGVLTPQAVNEFPIPSGTCQGDNYQCDPLGLADEHIPGCVNLFFPDRCFRSYILGCGGNLGVDPNIEVNRCGCFTNEDCQNGVGVSVCDMQYHTCVSSVTVESLPACSTVSCDPVIGGTRCTVNPECQTTIDGWYDPLYGQGGGGEGGQTPVPSPEQGQGSSTSPTQGAAEGSTTGEGTSTSESSLPPTGFGGTSTGGVEDSPLGRFFMEGKSTYRVPLLLLSLIGIIIGRFVADFFVREASSQEKALAKVKQDNTIKINISLPVDFASQLVAKK